MQPISENVRFAVPADHRWLNQVCTLVAAAVDPARFPVDRLQDLSLALGETLTKLVETDGAERLRVEMRPGSDSVDLSLEVEGEEVEGSALRWNGELAGYLLEAVAGPPQPFTGDRSTGVRLSLLPA